MIDYTPLWETMKRKGITKYFLMTYKNIPKYTLTRMSRNLHTSTETLERLCEILECEISDIIKYKPNKK